MLLFWLPAEKFWKSMDQLDNSVLILVKCIVFQLR